MDLQTDGQQLISLAQHKYRVSVPTRRAVSFTRSHANVRSQGSAAFIWRGPLGVLAGGEKWC